MKESEMRPQEVHDAIAGHLEGAAHDHWAGMSRQDRNALVVDVQRGELTIEEAAAKLGQWARVASGYCVQNDGDCSTCSLVNYGRDCQNNPV